MALLMALLAALSMPAHAVLGVTGAEDSSANNWTSTASRFEEELHTELNDLANRMNMYDGYTWVAYNDYDLPNVNDVEAMEASDIDAVKRRAIVKGYEGFSVNNGWAFFKDTPLPITKDDLVYTGGRYHPVVFYIRVRVVDDEQVTERPGLPWSSLMGPYGQPTVSGDPAMAAEQAAETATEAAAAATRAAEAAQAAAEQGQQQQLQQQQQQQHLQGYGYPTELQQQLQQQQLWYVQQQAAAAAAAAYAQTVAQMTAGDQALRNQSFASMPAAAFAGGMCGGGYPYPAYYGYQGHPMHGACGASSAGANLAAARLGSPLAQPGLQGQRKPVASRSRKFVCC